jgi:1-phosphatidylinositol phosphodiesterase
MAYIPFRGFNWMRHVDGSKLLSELTIPGTHDTAGRFGELDQLKTQKRDIPTQLTSGIRFLDIRCRQINDTFQIHHDYVDEHINFDDVLNLCFKFLKARTKETIIMSVKPEDTPSGNKLSFEKVFDGYVAKHGGAAKWYFKNTIPTLDEVRGKIVLFRRFATDNADTVKGLNALDFRDDDTFTIKNTITFEIQDNWVVETVLDRAGKWKKVRDFLEKARQKTEKTTLYVNFTSGGSAGSYPNNVAEYVNPRVMDYFRQHTQGHFGIIPMDFEETKRTILVAHTNTPYVDGYWILTNKTNAKPFGNAASYNKADEHKTDAVDMAITSSGKGYWIAFKNGDVHSYGDAGERFGRATRKDNDTVAIAAKPDGTGYWLLFKDGRIAAFGTATDYGDFDAKIIGEAVDIVAAPKGNGYWILSKNGNVSAFGEGAKFYGQGKGGDNDAVSLEITKDGTGYWILSKNGGVHYYGTAKYYGHGTGGHGDAVSIVRGAPGGGYWILAKDGTIQRYGNVPYDGDGLESGKGEAVSLCRTLITGQ